MGLSLRIFLFIVISEAAAGFVEDNQNIFYGDGHSEVFESAPISYQSFVSYDSFPTSDRSSFDAHSSSKPNAQSINLFKSADYAEERAYEEEVENAHRVALAKRHNSTDAAYGEAYTEALKALRKAGSGAGAKTSYISHLLPNKFGFNPEHSDSRLSAEPKSNYFQSHYEDQDLGKVEYYFTHGNHDLRKSVEYIVVPDYKFNANGVVHRQP